MRIWDFDGVIFNSSGDYSDIFLYENLHNKTLVATLPAISECDLLITGRSKAQKYEVKEILQYNNLYFEEIIFSDFEEKDYKSKTFPQKYIKWKADKIYEKASDYCQIIDDDKGVLTLLEQRYGDQFQYTHIPKWNHDLRKVVP